MFGMGKKHPSLAFYDQKRLKLSITISDTGSEITQWGKNFTCRIRL